LLTTSRPLVEAGFACGFTDQAHFTNTFVRFTGLTPSAYRESARRLTNGLK
jgi:AraC family transcriptional regulator